MVQRACLTQGAGDYGRLCGGCTTRAAPADIWRRPHHNFAYSAEARVPLGQVEPILLNQRKLIARRAAFELLPNAVVNLGVGVPEGSRRSPTRRR